MSSFGLKTMAARVAELAATNSLRLFDAMYLNEPDLRLDGESVSADEVIEIAALTAAPFVSIDMDEFDPAELLVQINEDIPEDSPAMEQLRQLVGKADSKYRGMTERLWLRWGAQGLTYEWSATADWRRQLAVDMARATYEGQQESAVQAQARDSEVNSLVAILMDSPDFRAAMPTKRIPTGQALLTNHSADEDVIQRAASRASLKRAGRILEFEISLKPRLDELAEGLRNTPDWRAATSIPKRHDAAISFLMEQAEGHRLSSRISDPLMRAAKELDDSQPNKIEFVPNN